ncbi:Manganese transport system ATP-binding protein MntB [Chlamydiales bacterium STE3]|nr:Manganese transport system ATP-binding protein MntB [Chlamydiales bacterium STE3]
MDPIALEVGQLTVNYDKTPVLWDVSLKIPAGNLVGIIGPNGAGKSTFIKTALGLTPFLSGRIEFFGKALQQCRSEIAYVPQRESVDWDFPITVKELVLMGRYGRLGLFHRPRKADYIAVDYYLELVGMSQYSDRQISQLSGGQQQRVFLARALIQEAKIYFLDEPFNGVDLATEKILVSVMKNLVSQGKTVFVVHHDLNTIDTIFDWLIILNLRLVAYGPLSQVFNAHNLTTAYGKSFALFDEVLKLSQEKTTGEI